MLQQSADLSNKISCLNANNRNLHGIVVKDFIRQNVQLVIILSLDFHLKKNLYINNKH